MDTDTTGVDISGLASSLKMGLAFTPVMVYTNSV